MPQFRNLGEFLAARNLKNSIFKSSTKLDATGKNRANDTATWDPSKPYTGTDQSFIDRYGFKAGGADSPSAGSLVGERLSDEAVQETARLDTNPFSLVDNKNYVISLQDHNDMEYVAASGSQCAFDGVIAPIMNQFAPPPQPPAPPVVTPPVTPPVVQPPAPTPDRKVLVEALRSRLLASLSSAITGSPNWFVPFLQRFCATSFVTDLLGVLVDAGMKG